MFSDNYRLSLFAVITAILFVIPSCSQQKQEEKKKEEPPPEVTRKDELVIFLDSLEHTYELACFGMGTANWNSYSKEGAYDLTAAKATFAKIFLDTTARNTIENWRSRSNSLADKLLARRL